MGFSFRRVALLALVIVIAGVASSEAAVSIRIDYSKDTNNFFPAGSQARAAIEAAATFYSDNLGDTLSSIETPARFLGAQGGEVTWHWRRSFVNPSGGGTIFETDVEKDIDINADELVVYVGAYNLPGAEVGFGGPGGTLFTGVSNGKFSSDEDTQWKSTNTDFKNAVGSRQETSGFASWGGAIAFDNATTWHFNRNTALLDGETDFYSVSLHELGHVLGLGTSDAWDKLVHTTKNGSGEVTAATFTGTNAKAFFNNSEVPLEIKDTHEGSHWNQTTIGLSGLYGGGETQTPLMVPEIDEKTRRKLTNLDAAALADIGWEIDLPVPPAPGAMTLTSLTGSSAGFASLSSNVAVGNATPEPGGMLLAALAALGSLAVPTRRRGA